MPTINSQVDENPPDCKSHCIYLKAGITGKPDGIYNLKRIEKAQTNQNPETGRC